MVKKLHQQTDKKRGDPTWPFPTKLLSGIPKKERRKKVDTTQHEEALL
jgi:hypothetical protein